MTTSPREALERLTQLRGPNPVGNYYPRVSDLRADVLTLLSLLEWRPISEARHVDGERVLLHIVHPADDYARAMGEEDVWTAINVGFWNAAREEWEHETAGSPSHFLPLPPAPQEDSDER